jgi:hypothetical protein
MQLHKAIQTAAKFAATGRKSPDLYQAVMLLPSVGDSSAWVFATDGLVGCMVSVDASIPAALIPLDAVKPIARHKLLGADRDGNMVTFRTEEGGSFQAQVKDAIAYPRPPAEMPEMAEYPYWNHVWPILHAAAEEKSKQPTFKNIRFRPGYVEATDAIRVTVADVPGWPQDRLVPARMLKGWKDGRVALAFTDKLVFARRGDELRFAPLKLEGHFPDCKKHLPSAHDWPVLVVETKRMLKAVEKALVVSALKTVALDFNGPEVIVKSWNAEEGGKGFRAVVRGQAGGPTIQATKIINGKCLVQTLKAVRTPNVRLCYQGQPDGPLRVESGAMVEGLWPWRT